MITTHDELNELFGYEISYHSFFSEGTIILIDGSAYELTEEVGDQLVFEPSDDIKTAQENNDFFYEDCK